MKQINLLPSRGAIIRGGTGVSPVCLAMLEKAFSSLSDTQPFPVEIIYLTTKPAERAPA